MMFLINVSYIMVYSLSSLFLNVSLGVSTIWIGVLEGGVETVSYLMKLCSGVVSDYLRRRKPIMVLGYILTVMSKPILAISSSFVVVFLARLFERVGNGLQASPRDSMVTDLAEPQHRGISFGVMRGMGTAGSCLGGVIGYYAMMSTSNDFQKVFWIASVPAFLAILILILFVKEPRLGKKPGDSSQKAQIHERRPIKPQDIFLLGKPYWLLMIVVSIFMLARISETLMVLHAHKNFGMEEFYAPLIMSLYNLTYCLSSVTSGWFSDKFGRRGVLIVGVLSLIVSDFFLASATDLYGVFLGVLIWGVQMGVSLNIFLSLVADYVPEDLRGTGFGFYHLIGAISALIAGWGGGFIAHHYSIASAFYASMLVAVVSLVSLFFFIPKSKKKLAISAKSK